MYGNLSIIGKYITIYGYSFNSTLLTPTVPCRSPVSVTTHAVVAPLPHQIGLCSTVPCRSCAIEIALPSDLTGATKGTAVFLPTIDHPLHTVSTVIPVPHAVQLHCDAPTLLHHDAGGVSTLLTVLELAHIAVCTTFIVILRTHTTAPSLHVIANSKSKSFLFSMEHPPCSTECLQYCL